MNKPLFLMILVLFFTLSGCSLFGPVKTEASNTYVLDQLPCPSISHVRHAVTLLVAPPESNPVYDTAQMAYTKKPFEIAYFAKHAWLEKPGTLLQPLIIQTLINTHHFHAVVGQSFVGKYDYILNTEIQQLLQDYSCCPGLFYMRVRAQIISVASSKIIATREFSVVLSMQDVSPYNGVYAANQATAKILQQIAEFTVQTL